MCSGWGHGVVPTERQHLGADIAATEFEIGRIAVSALANAESFDGNDVVYLDALLTLVERVVPGGDRRVRAVERGGGEFDVIERGRCACDKVAVSSAVRNQRVCMHVIDEPVDEVVVLLELIGERGSSTDERETRCTCCQPADHPQQSARYVGAIHLVF